MEATGARFHFQPVVILFSIDFLSIALQFYQNTFDKNDSFAKNLILNLKQNCTQLDYLPVKKQAY